MAKMLVIVESRLSIPSSVTVNVRGNLFKILISIEDYQFEDSFISDYNSDLCSFGTTNLGGGRKIGSNSSNLNGYGGIGNVINDAICLISHFQRSLLKNISVLLEHVHVGSAFNSEFATFNSWLISSKVNHCGCIDSNYGLFIDLGSVPFTFVEPNSSSFKLNLVEGELYTDIGNYDFVKWSLDSCVIEAIETKYKEVEI
ncbi:hypothetical protein REPUB_Repub07fG0215200 [Reevesia pubescens]